MSIKKSSQLKWHATTSFLIAHRLLILEDCIMVIKVLFKHNLTSFIFFPMLITYMSLRIGHHVTKTWVHTNNIVTIFKDFSRTTFDFQEFTFTDCTKMHFPSPFQQDFKDWTVVSTNYPTFFTFNYLKWQHL